MRASMIVGAALAGLATASPVEKRQLIEFDQFDAADVPALVSAPLDASAAPGSYDPDAATQAAADAEPVAASSDKKVKRAACDSQPAGFGPATSPDTASDFSANPVYNQIANSASVPGGYALSFSGLSASTQAPSYITYKLLKSYDPYACQQICDGNTACYGFNLYFERDPTQTPGTGCTNPASTVNIKCALYGSNIDSTTAKNTGQYRSKFQVVISGSNGYSKLAPPPPADGFNPPVGLAGAINSPDDSYLGYKYFPGPYNPAQCAAATLTNNDYARNHPRADGTYDIAVFFNSYVLNENGVPQGTYCSLYSKTWGPKYATNFGQYRGSDRYTVTQSYGWTLASQ